MNNYLCILLLPLKSSGQCNEFLFIMLWNIYILLSSHMAHPRQLTTYKAVIIIIKNPCHNEVAEKSKSSIKFKDLPAIQTSAHAMGMGKST